ncbi:hypothetical protein [Massilia aquatica]|uniref:Uncharacterized protein n=1 Tax=Massilia aquatica TaxID=2609000 RepID=A0ABX0MAX4_9BURK|nr:hypothetical protein [Massilia aquatica]NHZ41692.1 hypothetical protein [Massilia aquatica]
MDLVISVAARDRLFAKAFRRVRPRLDPLCHAFAAVGMINPIHAALLIGLTDDRPPGDFAIVPNRDEYFQVLAGADPLWTDAQLHMAVLAVIRKTVIACPFSEPDREQFLRLLDHSGMQAS